jgi:linoleate 10R-lipoxygenase
VFDTDKPLPQYIARTLLTINERRRWVDPTTFSATAEDCDPNPQMIQQDDEIFNTARLVNCGHFMGMIFGDYVSGFLGLVRDGVSMNINLFDVSLALFGLD